MKQDHNKVKASTKATSGRVPVPFDVWTEIQDPENNMGSMRPSLSHPSGIQEDMGLLRQENQNLAHGVGQIEMMMQEVLDHLRRSSVKTET